MAPTTIRLDDETKKKSQKLAKEIGCSFNDLITILLKKVIREGGVDLRNANLTENGFSPEFENSVIQADKEGGYQEFDSIDDMIKNAK
ncbi:hypothetical protein COY07_01395 [Candidatus Peregrinibacteria bacterium CG_4_10_14_0_2_um_filter_43_11]|nr:MAG: hypothetical protein COY07_01395 [Candidatus Peregrinibacteria bacterium CG_4_10_14_0_2_um_filter_43_11]